MAGSDFKGWEGYDISEWRQGASLLATGKLIKFLQAARVSLRGVRRDVPEAVQARWSAKREQGSLCSARGNIVIKICTSTLHFPHARPPTCNPPWGQCRAMIYVSQDALSVSTASKLHPIIQRHRAHYFILPVPNPVNYYGIMKSQIPAESRNPKLRENSSTGRSRFGL